MEQPSKDAKKQLIQLMMRTSLPVILAREQNEQKTNHNNDEKK